MTSRRRGGQSQQSSSKKIKKWLTLAVSPTATFDLPENPVPSLVAPNPFQIKNIQIRVNGTLETDQSIDFFPANEPNKELFRLA
jgi:hypothetical protein